jgi:hypothetical protein
MISIFSLLAKYLLSVTLKVSDFKPRSLFASISVSLILSKFTLFISLSFSVPIFVSWYASLSESLILLSLRSLGSIKLIRSINVLRRLAKLPSFKILSTSVIPSLSIKNSLFRLPSVRLLSKFVRISPFKSACLPASGFTSAI